jgi:hypothetical protein
VPGRRCLGGRELLDESLLEVDLVGCGHGGGRFGGAGAVVKDLDRPAPDRRAARQANPQNTARLGPGPQFAALPVCRFAAAIAELDIRVTPSSSVVAGPRKPRPGGQNVRKRPRQVAACKNGN